MLENAFRKRFLPNSSMDKSSEFSTSDGNSRGSNLSKNRDQSTRFQAISDRETEKNSHPISVRAIREIFTAGLDALQCLEFEGNFKLSSDVRFVQFFAFHITGVLTLEKGVALRGLQGLQLTARKVLKPAARILSGGSLEIKSAELNNSAGGMIDAKGRITLNNKEIDNRGGKMISSLEEIHWLGEELGIFDNSHGHLKARSNIKLGGQLASRRPNTAKSQLIFLNEEGTIQVERGQFNAKLSTLFNVKGRLIAPGIYLSARNVENCQGHLLAQNRAEFLIDEYLGNTAGQIKALDVQLRSGGNFENCAGLLSGTNSIRIQARVLGPEDSDDVDLSKLLLGKIISERGSIYLASQRPLILSDDLTASQKIEIISDHDITNLAGLEWNVPGGLIEVQSGNKRGDKVRLRILKLNAHQLRVRSNQGPVELKQIDAKADLEISAQDAISLDSLSWNTQDKGVRIVTDLTKTARVFDSYFWGAGALNLMRNQGNRSQPQLFMENTHLGLDNLIFHGQLISIQKCTIVLKKLFEVCSESFESWSSQIESDETASIDTQGLLKAANLHLSADVIIAHSQFNMNYHMCDFRAREAIYLKTIDGSLFFRGRMCSENEIRIHGPELNFSEFRAWCRERFLAYGSMELSAYQVLIFARGDELTLGARENLDLEDTELSVPDGNISTTTCGHLRAERVSAMSATHLVDAESTEGRLVYQYATEHIEHYAHQLKLRESVLEIQTARTVAQPYFETSLPRMGNLQLHAKERLSLQGCQLASPAAQLQGQTLEIEGSQLQHSLAKLTGGQSVSLYDTSVTGASLDLQAPEIKGARLDVRVKDVGLIGRDISLEMSHLAGKSLKVRAERALQIARSQFAHQVASLVSQNESRIAQTQLTIKDTAELSAPRLHLENANLESRKAHLIGRSSLKARQTSLLAQQWHLEGRHQHLEATVITGKVKGTLQARQVQGRQVVLAVQRGDAVFNVEFATFENLLAIAGGHADFRASVLRCEASEFRIGQNLSIRAGLQLALQRTALRAQNAYLQSNDVHIINSSLSALGQLNLLGQRGIISHSSLESGGQLISHFSQLQVRQSVLRARDLLMGGRALQVVQSALEGARNLALSTEFQLVVQSSLNTDGLLRQRGQWLFGFGNKVVAQGVLQTAALAIFGQNEQRQARWISRQVAPLVGKFGGADKALLLVETALGLLKPGSSQDSPIALSQAAFIDLRDTSQQAGFLRAKAAWRIWGDRAHFAVQNGRLQAGDAVTLQGATGRGGTLSVESEGRLLAPGSRWKMRQLQLLGGDGELEINEAGFAGDEFFARANRIWGDRAHFAVQNGRLQAGDAVTLQGATGQGGTLSVESGDRLLAPGSRWQMRQLQLLGGDGQLNIDNASLQGGELTARAVRISQQNAQILMQSSSIQATRVVDSQGALVAGEFHLRAPQALQQGARLVPIGDATVEAADMQTDDATVVAGPGTLEATFANDRLYGQSSVGALQVNSQSHQFENHMNSTTDHIVFKTPGPMRNCGAVSARVAEFAIGGQLRNEGLIEGQVQLDIDTQRLHQEPGSEIVTNHLNYHQQDPLVHSELGELPRVKNAVFSSDGQVTADKTINTTGFIGFVSRNQNERVRLLAPVTALGGILLEGSDVDVQDTLNVGGRLFLRFRENLTGQGSIFGGDGADISGGFFHNVGRDFKVRGPVRLHVKDFLTEPTMVIPTKEEFEWNWAKFKSERVLVYDPTQSYGKIGGNFHVDGDLETNITNSARNIGGEFLVSGTYTAIGKPLDNLNITHSYTKSECVGYRQKRFCGFKTKKIFLHEDRTYTVVDAIGLEKIGQTFEFDFDAPMRNEGIILAGHLRGRVQGLDVAFERQGLSQGLIDKRTGLALATIHSQGALQMYVEEHSRIRGQLTSDGDYAFSTQTLDARPSEYREMTPLFKQGGAFGSDSVSWQKTQRLGQGGIMTGGGTGHIEVREMGWVKGAYIKTSKDLMFSAKRLDLTCAEEKVRADLPGRTSAFKTKELHAIHTHFRQPKILSDGRIFLDVEERLENQGAFIHGKEGTFQRQGQLAESIPMAQNKVEQSSGWKRTTNRSVGVSSVPVSASTTGDVKSFSSGEAHFAGLKAAPLGSIRLHGDKEVTFDTYSQVIAQEDRDQTITGSEISWSHTRTEQLHAEQPRLIAQNVLVTSNTSIKGFGLQMQVAGVGEFDAPTVEMLPHHFALRVESSGGSAGISSPPGLRALKNLSEGQSIEDFAKDLVLSDPAIGQVHALVTSECGEEAALNGLSSAIQIWKAGNAISLAGEGGSLMSQIGQRAGLCNGKGAFQPKITAYLQLFTSSQEVRDALPCQLSAGKYLIIRADEQRYQGADLVAPQMAFVGKSRKANVIFESFSQEVQQESDQDGCSVSYQGSWDVGVNHAESSSRQVRQRNCTVQAGNIHWEAQNVTAAGANISSETMTGEIERLRAESRYDTLQRQGHNYSASTSGQVGFGRLSVDNKTIQQTTFQAHQPSTLRVGELVCIGAATRNIQADRVSGSDMYESVRDRSWQVSLNLPEIQRLGQRVLSSHSPQNAPGISSSGASSSRDPRKLSGFFEVGSFGWRREKGSAVVRATAAGTLNAGNINRDWSRRRTELQTSISKGVAPLVLPDREVLSAQRQKLFGGPSAQVALPARNKPLRTVEASKNIEREPKPDGRSIEIETDERARSKAKGKAPLVGSLAGGVAEEGSAPSTAEISTRASDNSTSSTRRIGRTGRFKAEVQSRIRYNARCEELERARAARNDCMSRRCSPEVPQVKEIYFQHDVAVVEEREALATLSRNTYWLCQEELELTSDPSRREELIQEQKSCTSQMLQAQDEANSHCEIWDSQIQVLDRRLDEMVVHHAGISDSFEQEEHLLKMDVIDRQINALSARRDAVEKAAGRAAHFSSCAGGDKLEAYCQLNPGKVEEIQQQLAEVACQTRALKHPRKSIQLSEGATPEICQQLLADKVFEVDPLKFSEAEICRVAGTTSTDRALVNHLLHQGAQRSQRELRLGVRDMYEITDFFPRQKLTPRYDHPIGQSDFKDPHMALNCDMPSAMIVDRLLQQHTHFNEDDCAVDMDLHKGAPEKGGIFIYAEGKTLAQTKLEFAKEERFFVVSMNGINSTKEDIFNKTRYESKLAGGRFVIAVANPTLGEFDDLQECYKGRKGKWTEPTLELDAVLRGICQNQPQALILLHPHSGATIHSYNVLRDLPQEMRDRIKYRGASPAQHVPDELLANPKNIISSKDGCVDRWSLKDERNQVIPSIVKGNKDHDFDTPTLHAAKKEQTDLDIQESKK